MKDEMILTFGKRTEAWCMHCQRGTYHTVTSNIWQAKSGDRFITVICEKCHNHGYILMEDENGN